MQPAASSVVVVRREARALTDTRFAIKTRACSHKQDIFVVTFLRWMSGRRDAGRSCTGGCYRATTGLGRAHLVESLGAVGRLRVAEYEQAGREFRHDSKYRPVGQWQPRIRRSQNGVRPV